jgi:23S rRNA (cytidine1920-2'-O)/16S rRNA (cytidine1409-2'-O)-methyltransferase
MRLDLAVVDQGLARSRSAAQALILSGRVRVDGTVTLKPAYQCRPGETLAVEPERYVSRAAYKLIGALDDFDLQVPDRALDAGASTGGFTQVLIERGCRRVYAVDVGQQQLAPSLRTDPRVVAWERINLKDLTLDHLDGIPVDLVVADVSFISLVLLVRPLTSVASSDADLVLLVKPQFEVGRDKLGKNGVVRSASLHRDSLVAVVSAAAEAGWQAQRVVPSRLPGSSGNREYFVHLRTEPAREPVDVERTLGSTSNAQGPVPLTRDG